MWPRQSLIGNLLYKPTLVPAASRCAHIVCTLDVLNGCFVLRFLAEDVGKELDAVLDAILRVLARRRQSAAKVEPLEFVR